MAPSRRHERHGRTPVLFRAQVPAARSRAQEFARLAGELFAAVREHADGGLEDVSLVIDDVPPPDAGLELGRAVPAEKGHPAVIVLHRLPISARCPTRVHLVDLLSGVLADQAGLLTGREPDELRPD